jgi:16S rRNA (guanine966-N2)-methyltransferase
MSLKILGGRFKDFPLNCPNNLKLRPTSVLLRRRIFDANQNLEGFHFFDACAGVGTVGIEALSRGASSCHFNEINKAHFKSLKFNLQKILEKKPQIKIQTSNMDILKWMNLFWENYERIQDKTSVIFFLDPPYEMTDLYTSVIEELIEKDFKGRLWLEACRQKTKSTVQFEDKLGRFDKLYKQGTSYIGVKVFSS